MRGKTIRSLAIAVAGILMLLSGCLFSKEPPSEPIDPPPDAHATNAEREETKEDAEVNGDVVQAQLYFKSPEGYVVPYTVPVPKTEGIAEESLRYMVKGGKIEGKGILPEGFTPLIPEGTKILGLNIKKNGDADLDLSKQFLNYEEEDEENILGAITWALTSWDSVKNVNLWINGKPLAEMPKQKTPTANMTRQNTALNIELGEGVQISNSMPVTLYFLGQSGESVYYVPVTRMVPRSEDIAQVALDELIAGPREASRLNTEILQNLEVNDVSVEDDTVLADFGEQLLEYGQENKVSERAIQSIVLSLTENTGAKQVKISVDGKSDIVTQNISLAEPVTRPTRLNPIGL